MIVDWLIQHPVFQVEIECNDPETLEEYPYVRVYHNSYVKFLYNQFYYIRIPFVRWDEDFITIRKLEKYDDAISLRFSGCYMAKFEDKFGNRYVSHIHVRHNNNMLNRFMRFCMAENYRRITIFKPYAGDLFEYTQQMANLVGYYDKNAIGIFDGNYNCCSAYILNVVNEPDFKCICRIIQHMNPLRIERVINLEQYHIAENHYHVIYNR